MSSNSSWNPFKGKRPVPDTASHSTLEVAQTLPQQYSTLEVVPGPSQYDSGLEAAPHQDGLIPYNAQQNLVKSQPQFDDGLQAISPPIQQTPAHPIISNPNRRIECGVWNEMKFYAGKEGMELTMSRGSTLVSDSVWQVNGGGWGILGIRGKTGSLNRRRGMFV